MFKKLAAIMLSATMVLSTVACTPAESPDETSEQTPTETTSNKTDLKLPNYDIETVTLKDLTAYKIVYPSSYDDYRKKDVKLLQEAIREVTGISVDIISDATAPSGKEIILAGSNRENGVEEAIAKFESGLDYIVAVRNGNIVLGGNNFYADMRAVYDFINNTLGYDDVYNKRTDAKSELSGVNYYIYEKPPMLLTAANHAVSAFTELSAIKDMADAHFNMVYIDRSRYDNEQLLDMMKWCARYEIFMIFRDKKYYDESYVDCPIIWSTYSVDEPPISNWIKLEKEMKSYMENYGKYGWKPFMNFNLPREKFDVLYEWEGLFDDMPMISIDAYFGHTLLVDDAYLMFTAFEQMRYLAKRRNIDFWSYIESYNITNRNQNTSKMLRWHAYTYLCFGTKNILYFQYGDASKNWTVEGDWTKGSLVNWDFSKNQAWYDAQKLNAEILKIAPIYNQYDNVGACFKNVTERNNSIYFESPYEYIDNIITDYREETDKEFGTPLLIGVFDKKDNSNAHALTIMNIEDLNDKQYETDPENYVEIKLNGENITFYRNGDIEKVEKTSDGYYKLNMANGYCWFVTID